MQKMTHISFGVFIASILYFFGVDLIYIIVIGFSAFLPDIDWLMDKLWFKKDGILKRLWYSLFNVSMHRTILHNIWTAIIVGLVIFLIFKNILLSFGFILGIISHLLADSLTKSGVYWLWPYGDERVFKGKPRKYFYSGNISTGDNKEKIIQISFLTLSGILFGFKFFIFDGKFNTQNLLVSCILCFIGFLIIKKLTKTISIITSRIFS